jgi:hypothetical protein
VSVTLEGGRPVIRCLDAGEAAFAEPFFDETVDAASSATPVLFDCDGLRAALDPSCKPAGFIFHMSRCGSTLVSQLLKEIPGVRVYSEPSAINEALDFSPEVVDVVVRAFCSSPARTFFKCSSWNVLEHALFEQLFPGVPKLFVVRRPVEVLASIAKAPPGFVEGREAFADVARRRAGKRTGSLSDLEFAAVMLSLYLDAMAAADGPALVLDYSELPFAVWRTLPAFFGIAAEEIDVARMESVARFHSKTYPTRVPFEKEDAAGTERLERYAAKWIGSRYDDLLATRARAAF